MIGVAAHRRYRDKAACSPEKRSARCFMVRPILRHGSRSATHPDAAGSSDRRRPSSKSTRVRPLLWRYCFAKGGRAELGSIADAILDRVMQKNHRVTLMGEPLGQKPKARKKEVQPDPS